jgi:hypothetical protein
VLTLPYLIGLQRADLLNPERLAQVIDESAPADSVSAESDPITTQPWREAAVLIAGTEVHALAGPERFLDFLDTIPDVYPVLNLLAIAVGLCAVWLIIRSVRRSDQRTPVDLVLLVWLTVPIVIYSITWTDFFIHYLIPILPAAFLILSFSLDDAKQEVTIAGGVGGGAVAAIQTGLTLALLGYLATTYTPGGFGVPLDKLNPVRERILGQNQPIIANLNGQAVGFDDEATVWQALLYDADIRFEDPQTTVYPEQDVLVLSDACTGDSYRLRSDDEGCYTITERTRTSLQAASYTSLDEPAQFQNGVRLLGYQWTEDTCVRLLWEITQTADVNYQFAVHLLDTNDNRIAGADGLSWLSRYWRPGDLVERRLCAPPVDGEVTSINIGMYTLNADNQFTNVPLSQQPDRFMVTLPIQ